MIKTAVCTFGAAFAALVIAGVFVTWGSYIGDWLPQSRSLIMFLALVASAVVTFIKHG